MLAEESVLTSEALVAIGEVPNDHVLDLPILLHLAPYDADVLPIFINDNMEVVLSRSLDVRHPLFRKVVGDGIGFKVPAVALCTEARYGVPILFLAVQIVEDVRWICKAHVCFGTLHQFQEVSFDGRIATHETRTVELVYIALLHGDLFDVELSEFLFEVEHSHFVFYIEDQVEIFRIEANIGEERFVELREEFKVKFTCIFVEANIELLFLLKVWQVYVHHWHFRDVQFLYDR